MHYDTHKFLPYYLAKQIPIIKSFMQHKNHNYPVGKDLLYFLKKECNAAENVTEEMYLSQNLAVYLNCEITSTL